MERPTEALTGNAPALSGLHVFGCDAQVLVPESKRRKLDAKTVKGKFLRYFKGSAYRFWIPRGTGISGTIMVARDAVFFEGITYQKQTVTLDADLLESEARKPVGAAAEPSASTPEQTDSGQPMSVDSLSFTL